MTEASNFLVSFFKNLSWNCLPFFFLAFSLWPYPSLVHLLWKYWTYDGYFFTGLGALKILNLGFNDITDECLVHLKGVFTTWNSLWIHFNASFCISLMSMKPSALPLIFNRQCLKLGFSSSINLQRYNAKSIKLIQYLPINNIAQ